MSAEFKQRFEHESDDVLDAIFAHSRDCIKLLNLEGELEYLSSSGQAALGVADTREVVGRKWREFWPQAMRDKLDSAMDQAREGSSARFDGYTEKDDGTCQWWEVVISPVRGADGMLTHLLAVSTNVTAQRASAREDRSRREEAEQQAGFAGDVAREMRHRLKNQLAVVGAVAKLLARHTQTARDLAAKLEEKLLALALAQDLLTLHRDEPILAGPAIAEVLAASGAGDRVEVGVIPEARLPDESIQALALILGELQTNALKYGAFRQEGGRVEISGRTDSQTLTLRWQEFCPDPLDAGGEGNGGFQLIRRLGSAGANQAVIDRGERGIVTEFHIRTAR